MSIETQPQRPMHSESLVELTKALAKVQAVLTPARRNADNPFMKSKYADLAAIWGVCRKTLTDNGLAITQLLDIDAEAHVLSTILLHESGEWLESRLRVLSLKPNDPQSFGSALTYARRYALAAIVGVAVEGEDDDAEGASSRAKEKQGQPRPPARITPPVSAPKPSGVSGQGPSGFPHVGALITRATKELGYADGKAVCTALGVETPPQILTMHKTFEAAWEALKKAANAPVSPTESPNTAKG